MLPPEFQKLSDELKGHLVLDMPHMAICRGIIDGEDDFYYDLVYWGDKETLLTCVTWVIDLKEVLPPERYKYMCEVWNLNNEEHCDVPNDQEAKT